MVEIEWWEVGGGGGGSLISEDKNHHLAQQRPKKGEGGREGDAPQAQSVAKRRKERSVESWSSVCCTGVEYRAMDDVIGIGNRNVLCVHRVCLVRVEESKVDGS